MSAIQYTVRSVPRRLDKQIRQKAATEHKSMNNVLLESLEHGLGLGDEKPLHHDLDSFYGRWQKDAGFDKAMKEFDRVDAELWQ
jgi:hypothetical protein